MPFWKEIFKYFFRSYYFFASGLVLFSLGGHSLMTSPQSATKCIYIIIFSTQQVMHIERKYVCSCQICCFNFYVVFGTIYRILVFVYLAGNSCDQQLTNSWTTAWSWSAAAHTQFVFVFVFHSERRNKCKLFGINCIFVWNSCFFLFRVLLPCNTL